MKKADRIAKKRRVLDKYIDHVVDHHYRPGLHTRWMEEGTWAIEDLEELDRIAVEQDLINRVGP